MHLDIKFDPKYIAGPFYLYDISKAGISYQFSVDIGQL